MKTIHNEKYSNYYCKQEVIYWDVWWLYSVNSIFSQQKRTDGIGFVALFSPGVLLYSEGGEGLGGGLIKINSRINKNNDTGCFREIVWELSIDLFTFQLWWHLKGGGTKFQNHFLPINPHQRRAFSAELARNQWEIPINAVCILGVNEKDIQ